MSAVYYDLNRLKSAIDWTKRAVSFSHNIVSLNFNCLYICYRNFDNAKIQIYNILLVISFIHWGKGNRNLGKKIFV